MSKNAAENKSESSKVIVVDSEKNIDFWIDFVIIFLRTSAILLKNLLISPEFCEIYFRE